MLLLVVPALALAALFVFVLVRGYRDWREFRELEEWWS